MSGELITKEELERSDSGSYYISASRLHFMWSRDIYAIERAMEIIIQANPEFEFMTEDDLIRRGKWIHWRRRKQ